ncbi:MAG: SDR family oxidoreductase [Ideonella sp.]|nr:SDR family oxidoreductase [Ideonella sp.]
MIVVTGATGQLGRLVIRKLLETVPASQVVAAVRQPAQAADLAALGVQVRAADYTRPATLAAAFAGARKLLLISSSEVGQRTAQHRAVIDAAREAGVGLLAYTSLLRAPTSGITLAAEHRETEVLLAASGLPHVVLRNGWYTENYTGSIGAALAHGVVLGAAGAGRIASAARVDYAEAAAAVLLRDGQAGQVYELAGDEAFTLADYAAEITRQSGRPVAYQDLPEAGFQAALVQAGLPEAFAAVLAQSSAASARGELFDGGRQLSALIGRPTTPLADSVAAALKA